MLTVSIPEAFLFYGKTKRRTPVAIDTELRALTENLATRLHIMIANRETPRAIYEKTKCSACSLIDDCLPRLSQRPPTVAWFARQLAGSLTDADA